MKKAVIPRDEDDTPPQPGRFQLFSLKQDREKGYWRERNKLPSRKRYMKRYNAEWRAKHPEYAKEYRARHATERPKCPLERE